MAGKFITHLSTYLSIILSNQPVAELAASHALVTKAETSLNGKEQR